MRCAFFSHSRRWTGLLLIWAVALTTLAVAWHASRIYYRQYMPQGDGIWYFQQAGHTYYIRRQLGLAAAVAQLLNSNSLTILTPLLTAGLATWMPLTWQWAVGLNGFWYLLLATSLYALFWSRCRDWRLATVLTLPLLVWLPPLGDISEGLTDLHCNHLGYTLGGSVWCWLLLSDGLRRTRIVILAGVGFGLLSLGRWFSAGLLFLMFLPLWWRALTGDRTTRRNFGLFVGVVLAVAGWWAVPRIGAMLHYPIQYYGKGILGSISLSAALHAAGKFVKLLVQANTAFLVFFGVAGWTCGWYSITLRDWRIWLRNLRWEYLWMTAAPLLVSVFLRSWRPHYIWPAVFGIYMFFLYPLRQSESNAPVLSSPLPRALLGLASLAAVPLFLHAVFTYHCYPFPAIRKDNIQTVIEAIRTDAVRRNRPTINVDTFHHGVLTFGRVADWFMFDAGCPVEDQMAPPCLHAEGPDRPVVRLAQRFFSWPKQMDDAQLVNQIVRNNDYLIVLLPDSPGKLHWPDACRLSRLLLASPDLRRLTPPLDIADAEKVLVLTKN